MIFDDVVVPLFEATREGWLSAARDVARQIAARHGRVTIDDVRALCPPPEDVDPRVMGAVFRPTKQWACVGYERSKRSTCHNRPIGIFEHRAAS